MAEFPIDNLGSGREPQRAVPAEDNGGGKILAVFFGMMLLGCIARQAGFLPLVFVTVVVIVGAVGAVWRVYRQAAGSERGVRWTVTGIAAIIAAGLTWIFVYTNFFEH